MRNDFLISKAVQEYIEQYSPQIAILAPSLDTIPSKEGNAIYCIIEDIVFHSKYPIIVFSVVGENLPVSKIQNQIIYYKPPLKKTIFQHIIGHRFRKFIYGISYTEDISYSTSAYTFCTKNNIICLMVEDSNSLLAGLPKKPEIRVLLHQHANALLSHSNKIFQKFISKTSEVIFVSKRGKTEAEKKFGKFKLPVRVIYNGIDLKNYYNAVSEKNTFLKEKLGIHQSEIVLLFVGRLHPSKGVKELMLSVDHLKDDNVKLLIAGNLNTLHDNNNEFANWIKTNTAPKIILLGGIPQSELPFYYQLCDFVVVPSIGKEGLPKTITEALVMGKPVIASDRGGVCELVKNEENGIIIQEPVSPENIANAVNKAIRKKEYLTENSQGNLSTIRQKFSSESMAKEFDAVFEKYI